ncbi:MAG TPA: hypothetical protein VMV69_01565 [Pirellulales bacterium]|nr:hypothetical protein [Pirellulales bacterium]
MKQGHTGAESQDDKGPRRGYPDILAINQMVRAKAQANRNKAVDLPTTTSKPATTNSREFNETSVYTILHSKKLATFYGSGRRGVFTEGKKWVSAQELLESARKTGQLVPVIFAPGERTRELTHFGILEDVKISQDDEGKWTTTVSVRDLTKMRHPRPAKTQLVVSSTGLRLPANHIRPYVIVQTPKFLDKQKTKTEPPAAPVARGGARVPTETRSKPPRTATLTSRNYRLTLKSARGKLAGRKTKRSTTPTPAKLPAPDLVGLFHYAVETYENSGKQRDHNRAVVLLNRLAPLSAKRAKDVSFLVKRLEKATAKRNSKGRAAKAGPASTRRDEFTDSQKAEIFARDRAICCFSGKSLWLLDYGAAPSSSDWVDHIVPASKGGRAELENGTCASWLYNWVKRDSGHTPYLFRKGRPTDDFFTFHEILPDHIARNLRRLANLHYSDWYFNRAVSHVTLAAAVATEIRVDGTPFKRGPDYWCRAALKRLLQWQAIVETERPADFASRALLPPNPSEDHELLIKLTAATELKEVVRIASTLAPFSAASWRAMVDLSFVENASQAFDLVKRVDADGYVVPRIKEAIRHNVEALYR